MSVEKMRLLKISGNNDKLQNVAVKLFESGCFQPEQIGKYISSSLGFIPYGESNRYTEILDALEQASEQYDLKITYMPDTALSPFTEEEGEHLASLQKQGIGVTQEQETLMQQKDLCEETITKLNYFSDFPAKLDDIAKLDYIKVRFGRMPKENMQKLDALFKKYPYFYFVPCKTDKEDCWGTYFALKNRLDEVDGVFALLLFEKIEIPGASGTIAELIDELKSNLKIIQSQLSEIDKRVADVLASETNFINLAYSKLYAYDKIEKIKSYSVSNPHYFMLAGWLTSSKEEKIKKILSDIPSLELEFSDPNTDTDSPPVKIRRKRGLLKYLVDPYNFYVDMYGTPSYTDIDVSTFVAITYTLMFGIMFGDMGQGFVLALIGFLMYKFKHMGLGKILIPCGLSSMIFGFLFGSVFGYEELLDPVYKMIGLSSKPLSVMDSVGTVLLFAICIGIALTALAICLGTYASIKNKKIGEAIFSHNGLVGLCVYISAVNLASGFMKAYSPIPTKVCFAVLITGLIILVIKEIPIGIIDKHPDWKPESIGDFLLQNIFELLECVLSYLSNTVSFLRVGAFVLVHAGMMMVVFSLAGENENIFVIILGNILVIALEGLLTGIQALRLEYYEMFSRFYKGDGRPFIPFTNKQFSIGGIKK